MEIKTKYKIGDKIYTISDQLRAVEKAVKRIAIFVWPDETRVSYYFEEGGDEYEDKCFSSLSDLLKQVKGDMEL